MRSKYGFWKTLLDIVCLRCPRCRRGPIFRGWLTMNDLCPDCGLLFEREEGYFLGAMYFTYAAAVAVLATSFLIATALLPDWSSPVVALLATLPYLPLMPFVFRYSRVLWIYYDRAADQHGHLSTEYERSKLKQHRAPRASSSAETPPR